MRLIAKSLALRAKAKPLRNLSHASAVERVPDRLLFLLRHGDIGPKMSWSFLKASRVPTGISSYWLVTPLIVHEIVPATFGPGGGGGGGGGGVTPIVAKQTPVPTLPLPSTAVTTTLKNPTALYVCEPAMSFAPSP